MAGMIGQDPPTMKLLDGGVIEEAEACLRHIDSILGIVLSEDGGLSRCESGGILAWNIFVSYRLQTEEKDALLSLIKDAAQAITTLTQTLTLTLLFTRIVTSQARACEIGGQPVVGPLLGVPRLPRDAKVERH